MCSVLTRGSQVRHCKLEVLLPKVYFRGQFGCLRAAILFYLSSASGFIKPYVKLHLSV